MAAGRKSQHWITKRQSRQKFQNELNFPGRLQIDDILHKEPCTLSYVY